MKRTAALAALIAALMVGAPAVASASAVDAPATAAAVQQPPPGGDGESEPPPPTDDGNAEPPPPTSPWQERVNAAFDRAIAQVRASQLPPRVKQQVVRLMERTQGRLQMRWR